MPRGEFSEIDHAADLGLDLAGPDPGAIFEAAQRGLVQILFGETPTLRPDVEREVEIQADGYPKLLKAWCERLYRLIEDDGVVPVATHVEEHGPTHLSARVRGASAARELLASASELKAVTWHQLAFERAGTGERAAWRARVIFDV